MKVVHLDFRLSDKTKNIFYSLAKILIFNSISY